MAKGHLMNDLTVGKHATFECFFREVNDAWSNVRTESENRSPTSKTLNNLNRLTVRMLLHLNDLGTVGHHLNR